MPKSIRPRDYRQQAEFRHAVRGFLEFSESAARTAGLTSRQHQALLALKGFGVQGEDPTVGALAKWLHLKHHSAVELAKRLQQLKLVRRESDERDRRRVFLRLTVRAERVLESLSSAHLAELRRIRPALRAVLDLADRRR